MSKAKESYQQWRVIYCNSPSGNIVNLETVWMKAWNARGKVDAEVARGKMFSNKAIDLISLTAKGIAKAIEQQDVKG